MFQEYELSQLLSQLVYEAVSQEKVEVLATKIALHQVLYPLFPNFCSMIQQRCVLHHLLYYHYYFIINKFHK